MHFRKLCWMLFKEHDSKEIIICDNGTITTQKR